MSTSASASRPPLAIDTAKWKATQDQEDYAYAIFGRQRPRFQIERTDKTEPLPFDAWIKRCADGSRVAMVEAKCREFTYDEFTARYKSMWLLSESKLASLSRCALYYRRPAYGFLYFINCKKLLTLQIVSARGLIVARETKQVTSKEKYLEGTETRMCALISMQSATLLQWHGRPEI